MVIETKTYAISSPKSDKKGIELPKVRAKSYSDALEVFEEKYDELFYMYDLYWICSIREVKESRC